MGGGEGGPHFNLKDIHPTCSLCVDNARALDRDGLSHS